MRYYSIKMIIIQEDIIATLAFYGICLNVLLRCLSAIKITLFLTFSWIFAYCLTVFAVQLELVAPVPNEVALFYAPHGIQLLAAWAYGWRSVLYLLPIVMFATLGQVEMQAIAAPNLLLSFFSLISAPLSMHIVRCVIANEDLFARLRLNWRFLAMGGLLATILNSGAVLLVQQSASSFSEMLAGFLWLVVSDMAGLMIVLIFLMSLFRRLRLLYHTDLRSSQSDSSL